MLVSGTMSIDDATVCANIESEPPVETASARSVSRPVLLKHQVDRLNELGRQEFVRRGKSVS